MLLDLLLISSFLFHGGTPEESNYKAFKEWVKPFQSKAQKGKADEALLDRAYTVTVPTDLIVVKIQKEFTNCVTDIAGWMEDDLKYLFSSPFWPLATTAVSDQILDDSLLKHVQVYLPGDKFYNQWLGFDESDYMDIWKIPGGHEGEGRVEMGNLRGKVEAARVLADPMRSYPDGAFPDGGAGGGMGDITGMADANDTRAKYLPPGKGVSLKEWSYAATSEGDDLYEHADWRHFDMQTLLNYLSMPGYTQGDVAPGPWLSSKHVANFHAKSGGAGSVPLRVIYFFSCSPAPTSANLHRESKALLGKHNHDSRSQVAEYIRDIRLRYRDAGHQCFLALREKMYSSLRRAAPIPKLASWHAVTAITPEEKEYADQHFRLYWEDRSMDTYGDHPSQAFTAADSQSSMYSPSQITEEDIRSSRFEDPDDDDDSQRMDVGGVWGGRRYKKKRTRKRRHRTRRRKRRRKRRRRRTRRKRRKRRR